MSRSASVAAAGLLVTITFFAVFLGCPPRPHPHPVIDRVDFESAVTGSDREAVARRFGQPARFQTGAGGGGWGYERVTAEGNGEPDAVTWVWFGEGGKVERVSYGEP